MTALQQMFSQSGSRIALAIALSLLIHAAFLFGPNLTRLAPVEVVLPPLNAKLEPLPAAKPKSIPEPHPKHRTEPHKPALRPRSRQTEPRPVISTPAPSEIAKPEEAREAVPPDAAPQARDAEIPAVENAEPMYPLPRHAQLTFVVYKGTGFPVGEAHQKLDVGDDKSYILQIGVNTVGLASLLKTFELNQQSRGRITEHGLRPDEYSENKLTSKGVQLLDAKFDWQNRQLAFSSGNSVALPDTAQDMLSFLYQFSQMPLDHARLPMNVSNGKKLESYEIEVGKEEEIITRMGKIRALPLRKVHTPGEEGLEVWLGLEYRLLPVKIVQIDRNGEIAGQMVISEIRVSDE